MTDADLWKWALGVVASLLVFGIGAWLTAINSKLGKIADALQDHGVGVGKLEERMRAVEEEHGEMARADMLERMEREIGRRLGGLEDGVSRLNMRLDQVAASSATAAARAIRDCRDTGGSRGRQGGGGPGGDDA